MNKKSTIATAVAVVCIAGAVGAGVWYSNNNETAKKRAEIEEQIQDATGIRTQEATNAQIQVEVPTENPSAGVYEIKTAPSAEAVDDSLYNKIASLNTAAKTYFDTNDADLLCVYGMMYSDKNDFTVSASEVAKATGTEIATDIDDYADVLLIRPADLYDGYGLTVRNESDTRLKPFTAYHSSEGYIISSFEDEGGILTTDEYRSLLGSYGYEQGSIVSSNPDDETYWDIAYATDFPDNHIDVKYVAYNDKYAVAVVGGMTEKNNIRQYLLTKKPGGWVVVMEDLENSLTPRYDINREYPDVDLGLLPLYTMAKNGTIHTGFVEYEQTLIELGLISQADMPETYSCGAGKFAYIELTSGRKLLGVVNDSNQLEFFEVGSLEEAVSAMVQIQEDAPLYILHYNE